MGAFAAGAPVGHAGGSLSLATTVLPPQNLNLRILVFGMFMAAAVFLELPLTVEEDAAGGAEDRLTVRGTRGMRARPCPPTLPGVRCALRGRSLMGYWEG